MFSIRIQVTRPVAGQKDTTLAHQAWEFILIDNHLVLDEWAVWTRPSRRHKFTPLNRRMYVRGRVGRRFGNDGTIYLGPFDAPLPEDVKAEAKAKLLEHITVSVELPR